MKIVRSSSVSEFILLGCEKKETSPPAGRQNLLEVTDNTPAAPLSSKQILSADNISRSSGTAT